MPITLYLIENAVSNQCSARIYCVFPHQLLHVSSWLPTISPSSILALRTMRRLQDAIDVAANDASKRSVWALKIKSALAMLIRFTRHFKWSLLKYIVALALWLDCKSCSLIVVFEIKLSSFVHGGIETTPRECLQAITAKHHNLNAWNQKNGANGTSRAPSYRQNLRSRQIPPAWWKCILNRSSTICNASTQHWWPYASAYCAAHALVVH